MKIVCLANSRKLNGRCIAGKAVDGDHAGRWIRPVSARVHEEVSEYERQYEDGSDPKVLDVIDVPMLRAKPHGYQQENWLLDPERYWAKCGQRSLRELGRLTDEPRSLWIDGYSSYNGTNDRIPLTEAASLRSSLALIDVGNISLHVFAPGEAFGNSKRRVQGDFEYNGTRYRLWVTDPNIERPYLQREDGHYRLGHRHLCISLGEPHQDYCYKLIATII